MARYNLLVLAVAVVLLTVNISSASKYKKTYREGSPSDAKSRYVKQHHHHHHMRSKTAEEKEIRSETGESEEELSYVVEKPVKQRKTSVESGQIDDGNTESKKTCPNTKRSSERKRTRYVLVETVDENEPVTYSKKGKKEGRVKTEVPVAKNKVKRPIIEEEEDYTEPMYKTVYQTKPKGGKKIRYVVEEDAEEPFVEEAEEVQYVRKPTSRKRASPVYILENSDEGENNTGRRIIIEEIEEDV